MAGDSRTGFWNTDDFVPRLIKGCIQLGCAPDIESKIEMIPVDYASKVIVYLSRCADLPSKVFHVVGHQIPARQLFQNISSVGYVIPLRPYPVWRQALLDDADSSSSNALFPLLMGITETPAEAPAFDCRCTREALTGTELECPEINAELMKTYLTYFRTSGYLNN